MHTERQRIERRAGLGFVWTMAMAASLGFLGAGCSHVNTVVISDKENTRFHYRPSVSAGEPWKDAGRGQRVSLRLKANRRYDFRASLPGREDITLRKVEPGRMHTVEFGPDRRVLRCEFKLIRLSDHEVLCTKTWDKASRSDPDRWARILVGELSEEVIVPGNPTAVVRFEPGREDDGSAVVADRVWQAVDRAIGSPGSALRREEPVDLEELLEWKHWYSVSEVTSPEVQAWLDEKGYDLHFLIIGRVELVAPD